MADRSLSPPTTDDEWRLQDDAVASAPPPAARAVLPQRPAAPIRAARVLPSPHLVSAPASASHAGCNDALPGVDFEDNVFPSDFMGYKETIPSLNLNCLTGRSQIEVIIGEVYSPSHFWMLRVGPFYNLAVEKMIKEMTAYYFGKGVGQVLASGALREGQYCASLFDHSWHRSLIVSIIDSDTVKVLHVDYGSVFRVAPGALKPLHRKWASLPRQAVRARLAACRPSDKNWRWLRCACDWFMHRVQDIRFCAHVVAVDHQEDIVEAFLIDKTGAKDICLSREIIHTKYADLRKNSALRSSDLYLFPKFGALETGATPNYAEICQIAAEGILLDYVESYRSYVPGPWYFPNRPPTSAPSPQPLELNDRSIPVSAMHHNRMRHSQSTQRSAPSPACVRSPRPVVPFSASALPFGPPPERRAALSLRLQLNPFDVLPSPPSAGVLAPSRYTLAPPGLVVGERRLSTEEWAVLSHRRGTDAARWYMLTQPWRDMLPLTDFYP